MTRGVKVAGCDRLGKTIVFDKNQQHADFIALVVPLQRVPLVLVLFRQLLVLDALALELERHRNGLRRHEKAVASRLGA